MFLYGGFLCIEVICQLKVYNFCMVYVVESIGIQKNRSCLKTYNMQYFGDFDNVCTVCEHCSVNEIRQSNNPESNRGHYIKTLKLKFGNF